MTESRTYTTRRSAIAKALVEALKTIDGSGSFRSNLGVNVLPKLVFWDDINEFPTVCVSTGNETRNYQGGGFKDRILSITIRCYVNQEDPQTALEGLLEDIETVIENNSRLAYRQNPQVDTTQDIRIISIDTDEGVLDPLGVGEILLQVIY